MTSLNAGQLYPGLTSMRVTDRGSLTSRTRSDRERMKELLNTALSKLPETEEDFRSSLNKVIKDIADETSKTLPEHFLIHYIKKHDTPMPIRKALEGILKVMNGHGSIAELKELFHTQMIEEFAKKSNENKENSDANNFYSKLIKTGQNLPTYKKSPRNKSFWNFMFIMALLVVSFAISYVMGSLAVAAGSKVLFDNHQS